MYVNPSSRPLSPISPYQFVLVVVVVVAVYYYYYYYYQ